MADEQEPREKMLVSTYLTKDRWLALRSHAANSKMAASRVIEQWINPLIDKIIAAPPQYTEDDRE